MREEQQDGYRTNKVSFRPRCGKHDLSLMEWYYRTVGGMEKGHIKVSLISLAFDF